MSVSVSANQPFVNSKVSQDKDTHSRHPAAETMPTESGSRRKIAVGILPTPTEAITASSPARRNKRMDCLLKTYLLLVTCCHAALLFVDSSLPETVTTAGWICCLAAVFGTVLSRQDCKYVFASLLSSLCANLYVLRIGLIIMYWMMEEEKLGEGTPMEVLRQGFLLFSITSSLLIATTCTYFNMQSYLTSEIDVNVNVEASNFQQRLQVAMVLLYLAGFLLQEIVALQSFRVLIAEDFIFSAPGFALDFVLEVAWIYSTCLTILACDGEQRERFHTIIVLEVMLIKAFNLWFSSFTLYRLIREATRSVVASYLRALWVAIAIKFTAFQVLGVNKVYTLVRAEKRSDVDSELKESLML